MTRKLLALATALALLAFAPAAFADPPPLGTPAPAPGAGGTLDQKMHDFITGTWQTRRDYPTGAEPLHGLTEINFRADGKFVGTQSFTLDGSGGTPSVTAVEGSWVVQAVTDTQFILKATSAGVTEATRAEIVDPDTVKDLTDGAISHRVK